MFQENNITSKQWRLKAIKVARKGLHLIYIIVLTKNCKTMKRKNGMSLLWLAVAMMTVGMMTTSCEKNFDQDADNGWEYDDGEQQLVRFQVTGDFSDATTRSGNSSLTRGALSADGKDMTDLWVLDYVGGTLQQQLHQTSTDADFGEPQMVLDYGQHTLYFVCSRGKMPTLSTAEHSVTWGTVSDTFYKALTLDVTAGTGGAQTVALKRVATKLNIVVSDAIPAGTESAVITPSTWYYALDYLTGTATGSQTSDIEIKLGESFAGRENLSLSVFGLSGTDEWTTDVTIKAIDADNDILGQAVIRNAPFKANRTTKYTGKLFSGDGTFSITLDSDWDSEYNGTW